MKKSIVLLTAVLFAAGLFVGPICEKAFAKELKIGYVDLAKVFDEYKKTKDAEKSLEEKGKAKEADRTKMVDELKKMKDEQALLSEKGKAEKQNIIDVKIKALQEYDTKARNDLVKERNDALGGIMKDIEKIVTDYAKANGFDFVVNSRTMLYGSEQYDLTSEILARLNK
ncbi:MAG: OmpH family outer membrane protein [Candidatus Omnitrophica bacterium]|nr:OmpH family outer membrane protein [Candidatus Omnitrophota bacterium]MDD5436746.1 OmpH family outer membrane protein [Candidatus Omnitrophota bacterium]